MRAHTLPLLSLPLIGRETELATIAGQREQAARAREPNLLR